MNQNFEVPLEGRRWLSVRQASSYLGIHLQTLYVMLRRGQVPFVKRPGIGVRVDRVKLDEMLAAEEHIPVGVDDERRRRAR